MPENEELEIRQLNITKEKIELEEIEKVIKSFKRGKAAEIDEIPIELIQANINRSIEILHLLINKIWKDYQRIGRKA